VRQHACRERGGHDDPDLGRARARQRAAILTGLSDLEEFLIGHRPHGALIGDTIEPAWNGYLLTVACPCGVVFERWISPLHATEDLLLTDLRPARY